MSALRPAVFVCLLFLSATQLFPAKLSNDLFADRTVIEGPEVTVTGDNSGAGLEPDEPLPTPSVTRTLWWSWAAPADGRVVVTPFWIVAQGAPSLLAIYTGPVVDRLIPVPARAEGPEGPWTFAAKGGVIYHFQLWPHTEGTEPTGFDLAFLRH